MPRRHRQARGGARWKRAALIPPKRRCHALRKSATVKGRKPSTVRPRMQRPHRRVRRPALLKRAAAILRRRRCHALRKCGSAKGHKPSTIRLATHRHRPREPFRRRRSHIRRLNRNPKRVLRRVAASTVGAAERRSTQAIRKTQHGQTGSVPTTLLFCPTAKSERRRFCFPTPCIRFRLRTSTAYFVSFA